MSIRTVYPMTLVGLLCINATRCSSGENEGTGETGSKLMLTREWTKDMRVQYNSNGGMVDESTGIFISNDSAVYEMHEDRVTNRYHLQFSTAELEELAQVFYDNEFTQLKRVETAVVYDKPGMSVMVCKGAECCTHGDDATTTYEGINAKRLWAVAKHVLDVSNKKLEVLKIPFAVVVDEDLLKGPEGLHYQLAPGNISFDTYFNGRHDRSEYMVLPGEIRIMANTMLKDSLGNMRYPLTADKTFNTNEGNTIVITKKDSILNIEIKKI